MRSTLFCLAVVCALSAMMAGSVLAVGMVSVGEGKCDCPSLVAKGVVPDTINRLKETLVFMKLAPVLDRIAGEIKAMLGQFGARAKHEWAQKEVSPPKPKAKKPKKKKKKRVKVPPTAK
jgi:hypothetical protein